MSERGLFRPLGSREEVLTQFQMTLHSHIPSSFKPIRAYVYQLNVERVSCVLRPYALMFRRAAEPVCLCIHRWPLWCFVFVSYFVAVPDKPRSHIRDIVVQRTICHSRIHFYVNYMGNGNEQLDAHICFVCVCVCRFKWRLECGYVYILFICICAIHAIDAQIQY